MKKFFSAKIIFTALLFLLSVHLFSQVPKTIWDTVDCSKYPIYKGADCESFLYFLQKDFQSLDNHIIEQAIWAATPKTICQFAKAHHIVPKINAERFTQNINDYKKSLRIEDTLSHSDIHGYSPFLYHYYGGWEGDRYVSYNIITEKPDSPDYATIKTGSGQCSIS